MKRSFVNKIIKINLSSTKEISVSVAEKSMSQVWGHTFYP